MENIWFHIIVFICAIGATSKIASAQHAKKPFTVAEEIGLTLFDDPSGRRAEVLFSPDGNYSAVWSERGRLDINRVEDSLRFYLRQDLEAFLKHPDASQPPSAVLVVNRSDISGGAIGDWRWLPDSSGVAFIGHTDEGGQLMLADLRTKIVEPLTSAMEVVGEFDVRDREHYVYTAFDRVEREALQQKKRTEPRAATTIGTGHSLIELLFPDDRGVLPSPPSHLWAVISGNRFEVKQDGAPVNPGDLALSPDGSSLITILPVREVPSSWETLYPPPIALSPFRIRRSDPAHQYVRINLKTGSIQSLTDAPIGRDAGWGGGYSRAVWSSDGLAVLLPSTFLSSQDHTPSTPCVAVVDLSSSTRTCVAMLKGQTDEKGYHFLLATRALFAGGNEERVIVTTVANSSYHTAAYRRTSGGIWQEVVAGNGESIEDEARDLEVMVKEGLDQPPLLVAKNKQRSRVIWDPNPQLDNIELGHASVYRWKDKEGREWKGGLYEPVDYKRGQRYPLVIQTHGFRELEFRPSGLFPTGSAARSLAAAGMFVLQVGENCPLYKPSEAPCAVSSYESAVNQLVSEGLVDPERVGIIGFSRTCFWVMEALTTSSVHFKAALITDGFMGNYFQYITQIDSYDNAGPRQLDSIIGAPPFGENLQQWLKRSPGFNLDKITAPLMVVAAVRGTLLPMWEPYAGLRYLHKPTDLIILNTDEHVLTNPEMRLASQGGSVDWFRFWLKDDEDSDPVKVEQYARWQRLRQSCAIDCRAQSH